MEKVMSVEERIRRAEEIYNRRNGQYINTPNSRLSNKKSGSAKKLLMQIFVCLMIYLAFYVFTNSEYIFSEEFLKQVKSNLGPDSKIYSIYLNAKSFVEKQLSPKGEETVENEVKNEVKEETKESSEEKTGSAIEIGIGGAEEVKEEKKQESKKEEKNEKTEMEKSAEEIKKKISFINPINGRISSTFGWRTPTTKTVPKYHTGLDIAAETGTIIKSATDGEVILASSDGDYGKHYQIKIKDIVIVYAHCNKLYLKQGDKVKQGDKIAEVGSTGNSTGPHLHFEIRKGDERIDPQLILNI